MKKKLEKNEKKGWTKLKLKRLGKTKMKKVRQN